MKLESISPERFFQWWDADDDNFRIMIRADTEEEATKILGEKLLDLKANKIDFDKPNTKTSQ